MSVGCTSRTAVLIFSNGVAQLRREREFSSATGLGTSICTLVITDCDGGSLAQTVIAVITHRMTKRLMRFMATSSLDGERRLVFRCQIFDALVDRKIRSNEWSPGHGQASRNRRAARHRVHS